MEQPIRVLQVFGKLNRGGAESRTMDLYRNMDKSLIQFDFMKHTTEKCAFDEEIESLGGHVYSVPRFKFYNILSYRRAWKKFIIEHPEIKIVHGHMTSTAGIYLPIVKKYGQVHTIAHARNAGVSAGLKGKLTIWLRRDLIHKCDQCFTCSKYAGEEVFGKEAMAEGKVLYRPNAIDVSKFEYNQTIREKKRAELGFTENHYVLGHVGRFEPVKNQTYCLEILEECLKLEPNTRMVFLGDGPMRPQIEELAQKKGLSQYIIFAGVQSNVSDYYQAFDFFLLPSFYEGLPGVAIEAQTIGLRGIISDLITDETIITDLLQQMSIEIPASEWAKNALAQKGYERKSYIDEVRQEGFDVKEQVKTLTKLYMEATCKK